MPDKDSLFEANSRNKIINSREKSQYMVEFQSFSRIHYEFVICFAKSIWIHHPFREISMNSQKAIRKFTICFVNLKQFNFLFRDSTLYWLSFPRIHYLFTIFFSNSQWIHYLFRDYANHQLSFSPIHYLYRLFTNNFRGFGLNQPSVSRIHFEITIDFANSISICLLYSDSITYFDLFTYNVIMTACLRNKKW